MYKYLMFLSLVFFSCSLSAAPSWSSYGNQSRSTQSTSSNTALYYSSSCPHCTDVVSYINRSGKSVPMKNISNPTYKSELRQLGQRGVPVFVHDGKVITGSTNIINYIKTNF